MSKLHQFNPLGLSAHCSNVCKKHHFLIFALMFLSMLGINQPRCNAQFYSILEEGPHYPTYYTPTSVSNWTNYFDRYSVAVMPFEATQRIRLIKHDGFFTQTLSFTYSSYTDIQEIDIPNGMYIEDIETVGHYAVFCGKMNKWPGSVGVIGYIDLSDFIVPPTASVNISWSTIDSTTNIRELAVQELAGHIHVVALGEKNVNNYRYYFVVENTNLIPPSPASTTSYYVAKLSLSSTIREVAYEIKMTDNFFVLIEYETQDNNLAFRRCSRSVGLLDGEFDNIYYFSSPCNESLSLTHSTAMEKDLLAMSYLSNRADDFMIRVRMIDVDRLVNFHSQDIPLTTKAEPEELIYLPSANRFVLLQNYRFPTDTNEYRSVFINLFPNATNYTAPAYYYNSFFFYALDNIGRYSGKEYIAVGSPDCIMIKDDSAPWPGSNPLCPIRAQVNVRVIPNIGIPQRYAPLLHPSLNSPCSSQIFPIQTGSVHTYCTND